MSAQEDKKVLVLGLGETGGPLLDILKETYQAFGKDIDPIDVDGIDVMHVCYPFENQDQFVETTVRYIEEYQPRLVVINSTVVPGTTSRIAVETGRLTVFSPIRGKHVRMREELLKYVKFVAGFSQDAEIAGKEHFEVAGFPVQTMSSPEGLELAKLVETSYLGLLVGWAQEVERYANRLDADYYEVMKFVEEIDYLPPVIFRPGFIGGHCVIPNLDLLSQVMPGEFVQAIQRSNHLKALLDGLDGKEKKPRLTPIRIQR